MIFFNFNTEDFCKNDSSNFDFILVSEILKNTSNEYLNTFLKDSRAKLTTYLFERKVYKRNYRIFIFVVLLNEAVNCVCEQITGGLWNTVDMILTAEHRTSWRRIYPSATLLTTNPT
jgi:hypothetical protein